MPEKKVVFPRFLLKPGGHPWYDRSIPYLAWAESIFGGSCDEVYRYCEKSG